MVSRSNTGQKSRDSSRRHHQCHVDPLLQAEKEKNAALKNATNTTASNLRLEQEKMIAAAKLATETAVRLTAETISRDASERENLITISSAIVVVVRKLICNILAV